MGDNINKTKFDKFLKTKAGEYAKEKQDQLSIFNDVLSLLGDMNQNCDIQFKAHIDGIASVNYNLHGAGYGDLCAFFW